VLHAHRAIVLCWARRWDEAAVAASQAIALDPDGFYPNWALMAARSFEASVPAPGAIRRPVEAAEFATALLDKFGRHPWLMMAATVTQAALGNSEQADALVAELAARSKTSYVQPTTYAVSLLAAGRLEDGCRLINEAVDACDPMLTVAAAKWPVLEHLRGTKEFDDALTRMGWNRPIAAAKAVPPPTKRGG